MMQDYGMPNLRSSTCTAIENTYGKRSLLRRISGHKTANKQRLERNYTEITSNSFAASTQRLILLV
jgi:hypothetical protein